MLQIPLWNRLMIMLVVLAGLSFAMPNLFYDRVERHNDAVAVIEDTGVTTDALTAERALWPDILPSTLVNLGLDLRGGAHLLAEVQVADVYEARIDSLWPDVRDVLRDARDQVGTIRREDAPAGELRVRISQPEGDRGGRRGRAHACDARDRHHRCRIPYARRYGRWRHGDRDSVRGRASGDR